MNHSYTVAGCSWIHGRFLKNETWFSTSKHRPGDVADDHLSSSKNTKDGDGMDWSWMGWWWLMRRCARSPLLRTWCLPSRRLWSVLGTRRLIVDGLMAREDLEETDGFLFFFQTWRVWDVIRQDIRGHPSRDLPSEGRGWGGENLEPGNHMFEQWHIEIYI